MFISNKYQLFRVQRSDLLYELSGVHVTGMENNIIYVVFVVYGRIVWIVVIDK